MSRASCPWQAVMPVLPLNSRRHAHIARGIRGGCCQHVLTVNAMYEEHDGCVMSCPSCLVRARVPIQAQGTMVAGHDQLPGVAATSCQRAQHWRRRKAASAVEDCKHADLTNTAAGRSGVSTIHACHGHERTSSFILQHDLAMVSAARNIRKLLTCYSNNVGNLTAC